MGLWGSKDAILPAITKIKLAATGAIFSENWTKPFMRFWWQVRAMLEVLTDGLLLYNLTTWRDTRAWPDSSLRYIIRPLLSFSLSNSQGTFAAYLIIYHFRVSGVKRYTSVKQPNDGNLRSLSRLNREVSGVTHASRLFKKQKSRWWNFRVHVSRKSSK